MADAGNMWIVIVAMHVTADTHDQQRHLLIAVKELALCAVFDRIRVDGACIDLLDGALKDIIAFLQAALIRAENTLIFAGKGIAEAILQDGAGRTMIGDWPKYSSMDRNCSLMLGMKTPLSSSSRIGSAYSR